MHYHVTLWTKTTEFVTYDVEGASEAEAGARAADRQLAERPGLGKKGVRVAKIVGVGSYAFPPERH
jgi:hypothetical protein